MHAGVVVAMLSGVVMLDSKGRTLYPQTPPQSEYLASRLIEIGLSGRQVNATPYVQRLSAGSPHDD